MRLDVVRVRGYRSAKDVRLTDVGSFNVLIGRVAQAFLAVCLLHEKISP
jgi:hypothetical protein